MGRSQIKVEKNIYDDGQAFVVRFKRRGVKVNKSFAYDPAIKAVKVIDKKTNGERIAPSSRNKALNAAKSYQAAEWLEITGQGASVMNTSQLTLRPLLEEYLAKETPKKKGRAEETYRIRQVLRGIDEMKTLNDTPIAKLGRNDFAALSRHLDAQGKSPWTINRLLSIYSNVFKWAMKIDQYNWIEINLALGHSVKIKEVNKRIPQPHEIDLILAQTESHKLKLAILLGLETGARRSELVKTLWGDISLKKSTTEAPSITFRDLKNGDLVKTVPLSAVAVDLLESFDESLRTGFLFSSDKTPLETIRPHSITTAFTRAKNRAAKEHPEIADLRFHGIRGRFITDKAKIVNILILSTLSGHKNLNMLKKYYKPTAEELAEELGWRKRKKSPRE